MSSLNICHDLLSRTRPSEGASALIYDKIVHKPLFLRATSPNRRQQRRAERLRKEERIRRKRKSKPLSAKELRILDAHALPQEAQKYRLFLPLHHLWLGYMREILDLDQSENPHISTSRHGSILASADYHGAEIRVVQSECASLVEIIGIVVKDTKFTFQIISSKDELKGCRYIS